jgi:uncharacterized protein
LQEQMGLLRELQELDLELIQITSSRKELETEQAGYQGELDRVQEMVDNLADAMEALQGQRRELLRSQEQEQRNVERAESRLPAIKTQKEYVAVLKEIDTAKAMSREIQGQIDGKDAELAEYGKDREEKETELAEIQAKVDGRKDEIGGKLAAFDATLAEKTARKQGMLSEVPAQIRKRYQMLLDRRGGVAVVEAKKGACCGCHMHLPPQLYNSLFQLPEIQSCPHCNRLLYVEAVQ